MSIATGTIYGLYNKSNDKLVYIGQTIYALDKRLYEHRNKLFRYRLLDNDNSTYAKMNILVPDFNDLIIKSIQDNVPQSILFQTENKYILTLKPICNSTHTKYVLN